MLEINKEHYSIFYKQIETLFVCWRSGNQHVAFTIENWFKDHENVERLFNDKPPNSGSVIKIIGRSLFVDQIVNLIERDFPACKIKSAVKAGSFEVWFDLISGRLRITKEVNLSENKDWDKNRLSILIIDDSVTIQKILKRVLVQDHRVALVKAVSSAKEAIDLLKHQKFDAITLDLHMPEIDGVTFLEMIGKENLPPTLIVSALNPEESSLVFDALEKGAFDYLEKPQFEHIAELEKVLVDKLVAGVTQSKIKKKLKVSYGKLEVSSFNKERLNDSLILIGSSTGGTVAIQELLKRMPAHIPPILIVQHIPPYFSAEFAKRLDSLMPFRVKEAVNGDVVLHDCVYIAPGQQQMKVVWRNKRHEIVLTDDPPVNRFKPSADYLFNSAVELNLKMVGVILTGMGKDGAEGLLKLRQRGAYTIGQCKESCVVYGMPKRAYELGACHTMLYIEQIPREIVQKINYFK